MECFRKGVISPNASALQVAEMRKAYYCGALNLWDHVLHGISRDEDPTPQDMAAMTRIDQELRLEAAKFVAEALEELARRRRGQ